MLHCSYNKNIEKLLFENFNLEKQLENLKLVKSNDLLFLKSSTSTTVFTGSGHFFKIQPEDHSLLGYTEEKVFQITISRYSCDIPTINNYEIDVGNCNKNNSNDKNQIMNEDEVGRTHLNDNSGRDNLDQITNERESRQKTIVTQIGNNSDQDDSVLVNTQNKFKFTVLDSPSEFTSVKILSHEKNFGFLFISENRRIIKILKELFRESGIEELESENNANEILTVIQSLKNLKKI